jgi:Ion channel
VSQRLAHATSGCGGLWRTYFQWRYAILFYSLLFTFAAGPLLNALGFDANLLELFLALNLLAAVVPIGGRRTRLLFLTIVAAVLALRGGAAWFDDTWLAMASLAMWTVMALVAAANALRFTLGTTVVDREHLYAALSAYVLAGIFFGVFYWVLEQTWPGSLGMAGESVPSRFPPTLAIYFSFVTLATLGYGDIVPRSEVARGLAVMEAIAGQLYLAVMIARLVSLYVSGAGKGNHRDAQDAPDGSAPAAERNSDSIQ